MKWITSLLISCSLAVAGAIYAQQPDDQATPPKNNKHAGAKGQQATSETESGGTNANAKHGRRAEATGAQEGGQTTQTPEGKAARHANRNAAGETGNESTGLPTSGEGHGKRARNNAAGETKATGTTASESTATASATPNAKHQAREDRPGKNGNARNARNAAATASPSATVNAAAGTATPAAPAAVNANANVNAQQQKTNVNVAAGAVAGPNGKAKRVETTKLQEIKQQHTNFHAQARPDRAPAVSFNANVRIQGSEHWQGPQYEAFRSYHPERHDQGWYRSHYNRVELIGGGYYYWNNGYWYPAWGYDQGHEYYAYDGPVYVGQRSEPPDQVIADVQAELQDMGYYKGEVDGLLGPMTREALTSYQQDENLATTAAIDEPTLDALGMNG